MVALRHVRAGEELTLDYAQFCNQLSRVLIATVARPTARIHHRRRGQGVDARESSAAPASAFAPDFEACGSASGTRNLSSRPRGGRRYGECVLEAALG